MRVGERLAVIARMRCLLFVFAGCALHNAEPVQDEPVATSHVANWLFPVPSQHPIDLLFVIDRSSAMLAQHDRVIASMTTFASALEADPAGQDLHIGVVASDGAQLAGNRFLTDISLTDSFASDFSNPLADQLTALGEVGTDGSINAPIDTIMRAIDPSTNPGFRRDGADLVVQIITDQDDQSQRAVDDPALVHAFAGSSGNLLSILTAEPAPRLDQLSELLVAQTLIEYEPVIDIARDDAFTLAAAQLELAMPGRWWRGNPCFHGLAPPYDCTFDDTAHGFETDQLPACDVASSNKPCWSFELDPSDDHSGCPSDLPKLKVLRTRYPAPRTLLHVQCVTETLTN
jgi:hypothetical protein